MADPATTFAPLIDSVRPGLTAQVAADTMALIRLKDRSRAADVAAQLRANAATIAAGTITSGPAGATLFDGQRAGNAYPGHHRSTAAGNRLRGAQREARRPWKR